MRPSRLLTVFIVAGGLALAACVSRSSQAFEAGKQAEAAGRVDEAIAHYRRALAEDPDAVDYRIALMLAEEQARRAAVEPFALPHRSPHPVTRSRLGDIRVDLSFEDASLEEIFRALGRLAEVNILYDEAYRDVRVSVDLRGLTLEAALELLAKTHNLFLHLE